MTGGNYDIENPPLFIPCDPSGAVTTKSYNPDAPIGVSNKTRRRFSLSKIVTRDLKSGRPVRDLSIAVDPGLKFAPVTVISCDGPTNVNAGSMNTITIELSSVGVGDGVGCVVISTGSGTVTGSSGMVVSTVAVTVSSTDTDRIATSLGGTLPTISGYSFSTVALAVVVTRSSVR